MLKWKYQTEEDEKMRVTLHRVRRTGIDSQRKAIAKATLKQKFKELAETVDFQARFIDKLIMDKDSSLRLLDDVMEEFLRLDKHITTTEEEIDLEKEENIKLRSELNDWKTECENLRLCGSLLQGEISKVKPVSRSTMRTRGSHVEDIVAPIQIKDTSFANIHPMEKRLSQNETYQNIENESRLDGQGSFNVQTGLIQTSPCEVTELKAQMFLATDFRRSGRKGKNRRTETSRVSCDRNITDSSSSPRTTGCFKRFRLRRSRKVFSAS